jgi:hypothetical protein
VRGLAAGFTAALVVVASGCARFRRDQRCSLCSSPPHEHGEAPSYGAVSPSGPASSGMGGVLLPIHRGALHYCWARSSTFCFPIHPLTGRAGR